MDEPEAQRKAEIMGYYDYNGAPEYTVPELITARENGMLAAGIVVAFEALPGPVRDGNPGKPLEKSAPEAGING